jgi:glycosyltransferase involved in cell wall biosynthesis
MSTVPLRILQLYPKSDYFTGATIQLLELSGGLQGRGHHVVIGTRPSDLLAAKTREAGLRHYALPMASEVDLRSVRQLVRIVRQHRIQVVHAQKGKARTLAMIAGLFVRIPAIVLNRGVSFPIDPLNRLGYTSRRVNAVTVVSESIKRDLVAKGVRADKVHVIYDGTDTERFHPGVDGRGIRRELGLAPDAFLFVQVGVRSVKGNDDTIDALGLVAPGTPRAHLLIVGARRDDALRARAQERGVADRVHVWDYREDIPQIFSAGQCCIDASYAGLGLTGTLREALAAQAAAIATDLEGNPELVIDGVTGLLFPPRDVPALARAMRRMIDDEPFRQATARAGRTLVEDRFSARAKLDATERLYHRLVAARVRP